MRFWILQGLYEMQEMQWSLMWDMSGDIQTCEEQVAALFTNLQEEIGIMLD